MLQSVIDRFHRLYQQTSNKSTRSNIHDNMHPNQVDGNERTIHTADDLEDALFKLA